ncbi:MAG TPA: molybdenum cofactor guanylyltransferase [Ignavibacteria bacterium]
MYNDITGIILCGGKSSRMGINKAFLKLGESYIIEIISKLMNELFGRVIAITNEPELYKFLNIELFEDIYKDKGPLGGIHSGLIHSMTEKNFIISCDMPLISKETIKFITDFQSEKCIKVPFADGYIQQLCGVYSTKCLSLIEEIFNEDDNQMNGKKCMVLQLVEREGSEIINIEKEINGYKPNTFFNMNDMNQYEEAESIFEKGLDYGK